MDKFVIKVKVDQVVTREVLVEVEAKTKERAEEISTEFLQTYPEPTYFPEVSRAVTTKSHYWIPRSTEILESKKASK